MSIAMWNKLNEADELLAATLKQQDARIAALEKHFVAAVAAIEALDATVMELVKKDKLKGRS